MNQEASVSKSAASQSTSLAGSETLYQATSSKFDSVFPIFDHMMQKTKLPAWFMSLCAVFQLFQVLSIGFWIYAPPYQRATGTWKKIYYWALQICTFQNPNEYTVSHLTQLYICLAVSLTSFVWVYFLIYYYKKFLTIPNIFLYITSFVVDIIDPIFIIPSVYVFCHGITGVHYNYSISFIAEIVVGLISYGVNLFSFCESALLKSRSVVLTNLTFPLFDASPIIMWVIITSFFCIISAIMVFFQDWFYVVLGVAHVIMTVYIVYRISFVPFYEIWRNAICMAFGITTIALDVNFFILYAFQDLTYNFTIIVFIAFMFFGYILCRVFFILRVKKIHDKLQNQTEDINLPDYFSSLDIDKSALKAMMYIVVGLATLGDYFVDGSLTDYIINNANIDSALAILLQVVTFFPSESRKMNILFKKLAMKRKLGFVERFLIYQVYRIKTRRLVSDTKETLETFNKLKAMNDACKLQIRQFWDKQTCDNSFCTDLGRTTKFIGLNFDQILGNNPNNVRITNEYANFLAECMCDFNKAIVTSIKADLIADGKNFNVDVSFRSVVNKFPRYLKDGIIDTKGRRVIKRGATQKADASEQSSNSNGSGNTGSKGSSANFSSQSVDVEHQEAVGKRILRESKTRLAFHSAIFNSQPIQSPLIILCASTCLIVQLVFFIGFYSFYKSKVEWRRTMYVDLTNLGAGRFYTDLAIFFTYTEWAAEHNKYLHDTPEADEILGDISIDETTVKPVISHDLTHVQAAHTCISKARTTFNTLLNSLATLAVENNPYEIASSLLRQESKYVVCSKTKRVAEIDVGYKDQLIASDFLLLLVVGQLNMKDLPGMDIPNLWKDDSYCQVLSSLFALCDTNQESFKSFFDFNMNNAKAIEKQVFLWLVIGLVCVLIFSTVPELGIINSYNKLVDKTLKSLLELPNSVKEDAKKPLMINTDVSEDPIGIQKKNHSGVMKIVALIYFTFVAVILLCYFFMCWESLSTNKTLDKLFKWFFYSCQRTNYAAECGNDAIQLILMSDIEQYIMNLSTIAERAQHDLDQLNYIHKSLMDGNDIVEGSLGFDDALDKTTIQSVCDLGRDPKTVHDMYACANINQQVTIFNNMVDDILRNTESYGGAINNQVSMNVLHILEDHFYPGVLGTNARLRTLITCYYDTGMAETTVLLIVGCVMSILGFFMAFEFRALVNENYKMLLMLFHYLSPQAIVDTPELIGFFKRHQKTSGPEAMPISKQIVIDASECIVITNENSVVEIVNQAVTNNLGLTPDQMLGQEFANFVGAQDQAKITGQIQLMMNGQGSTVWEDHISMNDDSGELIPFSITMIGMKDNDDGDISSIVFILTNETEEIKKRQAAEEAKAKSEKLLYQILPKDIVVRLNRGEKDISFTIPSATIFFIDIVKFSEYAALLTPTEIMANLSLVFATFDNIVAEYESITKIKLIGDVYMAAAGLFQDPEDPSLKHAEDAVRCCIACSKAMEEINMKLNASLEVRIGCNTGGPLLGGVLGTDKPTFDIIGDPINVAARLQSTDIPGNVQISQDTKEAIKDLDFEVEERGEIYLKGKGNRITYFVSLSNKQKQGFEGSFAINIQPNA
ncbi:Adenylate and Guanylate cyclase catalytic domain containing protein [Trichomonas vaginalis G3]|uniref:Adenylate and Guanylate cyclase catalytic domain containing protein n=1 Tax=Trichomonas vaginalis (strain ATCC PRA-98 / G3) TaxID=412133 RepID=A2FG49_TRIV3|nr:guanylate cyclase protein [Trichomonas vaginalis G3]EAX96126.1 Adenylate and Guanylate cyclase catalytic domain containing protein [Trichomonas vaginalis G3]KAI5538801.1 guanylate cyclase protein [Trichomonas vaginalis G3]|eukprot:XP_001309056.1 Adenylate and Guanylate cyclase catalytic domain containing protein [Trichomonas vaginalis G3]